MSRSSAAAVGVMLMLFALLVFFMTQVDNYLAKLDCEAELPRNVECVWAPPQENK